MTEWQNLGMAEVGEDSLVGAGVIVGHPGSDRFRRFATDPAFQATYRSGTRLGARCIIRSHCVIYEDVVIGDDFQSGHGSVIRERVRIGKRCSIGSSVTLDPGVVLGDHVKVQSCVTLAPGTEVGDAVFLGPNVVVTDGRLMTAGLIAAGKLTPQEAREAEVRHRGNDRGQKLEAEVRVGANAVILAGVTVGRGSIVAAGAVVGVDVPAGCVVVGNPGRIIRQEKPLVEGM